jgi:uncharacterized protein YndB with AHSA1/START domain
MKSVTVRRSVEEAFAHFTDEIATWWPLRSHSVGEEKAETCVFEGRVGGKIYERHRDGTTAVWGAVTAWERPHRAAFTWHPGRAPDTAQEVEVRFTPTDAGTQVDVTHSGWERYGAKAAEAHAGYDSGWEFVLGRYTGQPD